MGEVVYLKRIIKELEQYAKLVKEAELQVFADRIVAAERIYVAGSGRSGFAARAFANRMMHLGLTMYFVGEPTTPSIQRNDLLIIGSGSGETASLVEMAKKAHVIGASIAAITIFKESTIGSLAETVVVVPGETPKGKMSSKCNSFQPMGNLFEQLSWLVYDSVVMILMERLGQTSEEMFGRHANLE